MPSQRAFDKYLNDQLRDPDFKVGFERKLATLESFVDLMKALDRARESLKLSFTDDWGFAYKRTEREYHARQAVYALDELVLRLEDLVRKGGTRAAHRRHQPRRPR